MWVKCLMEATDRPFVWWSRQAMDHPCGDSGVVNLGAPRTCASVRIRLHGHWIDRERRYASFRGCHFRRVKRDVLILTLASRFAVDTVKKYTG